MDRPRPRLIYALLALQTAAIVALGVAVADLYSQNTVLRVSLARVAQSATPEAPAELFAPAREASPSYKPD